MTESYIHLWTHMITGDRKYTILIGYIPNLLSHLMLEGKRKDYQSKNVL